MRLEGMSQRQIAAELHISRNTVKKYWDGDKVPWERKDYSREASVVTNEVITFVRQCLNEDEHSPRKQHHTARRIYERLVSECSFSSGESKSSRKAHLYGKGNITDAWHQRERLLRLRQGNER